MSVDGSMMIFASLQLPQNIILVNHAWQEWLVSSDGSLKSHALSGPNVQSFGTLDFTSANIVSQKVGGILKFKMMLGIVSNILFFFSYFFIQIAILYYILV